MFMHYGLIHLGLNMWALWVLGQSMEFAFGARRFLALFLLAGLGGNVAAWLFQPGALTAGASTAIFGLFSALFVTLKKLGRDTSSVVPIIVLNLVFTFSVPGISIAGHLGGFVTGAVVAYAMLHLRPIGPGETQHQLG
jgi:membrane associated rhomboid family serine protease